jgi:group II intron reverse transcriptase/maturase
MSTGGISVDVGEMQTKLSRWAEKDRDRSFGDLYNLLHDETWLRTAQTHVRQNAGSRTAGCDGVRMTDFEANLDGNLKALREALKAERFEPHPVRRKYIREIKASGRIKIRPLGIPDICDRIVQEALRMVLEPIWEADFSRHSYGFRPTRSTQDAVVYICHQLLGKSRNKNGWVIEGDIQSFFDTIDHPKLMRLLGRKIRDKKVLSLIWKFLRAGVMEEGMLRHTVLGTPQGGIISPLLANIYLNELDRYMEQYTELTQWFRRKRKGQGMANFLYVRYADDFVVLCDGTKAQATGMKEELREFLSTNLKLELSWDKTKITHIEEGFEFLGYAIDRKRTGTGKWAPRLRIPERAMEKARGKIRATLNPATHNDSVRTKIMALNRIIGGWCRYYQTTSSPSYYFEKLTQEVFWLMAHWLGRKYKMTIPRVMEAYRKGNTFGTSTTTLKMPYEYKANWHRPRALPNPYTALEIPIRREELDSLGGNWQGGEYRRGQGDLKEVVYQRDSGICGMCGKPVRWKVAILDHKIPRHRFESVGDADDLDNLQILHVEPCNRHKTKRDLQGESRVR